MVYGKELINELKLSNHTFSIFFHHFNNAWSLSMINNETKKSTSIRTRIYVDSEFDDLQNLELLVNWKKNIESHYDYGDLQIVNHVNLFSVYFSTMRPIIMIENKTEILNINNFMEETLTHGLDYRRYVRDVKLNEILK